VPAGALDGVGVVVWTGVLLRPVSLSYIDRRGATLLGAAGTGAGAGAGAGAGLVRENHASTCSGTPTSSKWAHAACDAYEWSRACIAARCTGSFIV